MTLTPLQEENIFLCHHKTAQLTSAHCANGDSEERGEVRTPELKLRTMGKSGLHVPAQLESNWPFCLTHGSRKQQAAVRKGEDKRVGGPHLGPTLSRGTKPVTVSPGQVFPLGRWERRGWREGRSLCTAAQNPVLHAAPRPSSCLKQVQVCQPGSTETPSDERRPSPWVLEAGRPRSKCCSAVSG